jgi:phosphoglycolate phosphatase-like HAD superfamily hydrolase
MIRNIIWDFDGTLFDTYPAIIHGWMNALEEQRIIVSEDRISDLIRISFKHCTETLEREEGVNIEELESSFPKYYRVFPPEDQPPFEGVREVCRYLLSIGGANIIITHRPIDSAKSILMAHSMADYFRDLYSPHEGYPQKPDPEMFQIALQQHRLKPEETLAVGDREIDILAGHAAGLRTCCYDIYNLELNADMIVNNYSQLMKILILENG